MTKLVTEELKTELIQTFTLSNDRIYQIDGIKIKLLMFNEPPGIFTLSIKQGSEVLNSADFTSSDIKSDLNTSEPYAWLYKAIKFPTLTPLLKGNYDLHLSSSGYTYSSTSFIGWVKSHENIFNTRTDQYTDITENPMDFLIYESTRGDLVR
jgi:hypothetical protein